VGGAKALFAFLKETRIVQMLWLHLRTTTAQEICDGIVAMGETLFSCYLYDEIMVR
jgi:hypothetical protein